MGITKSREFWLSDIHHLNDINELKDALDELNDVIYPIAKVNGPTNELLKAILERAENFSEWGLFVGSFSEEHDLLSQWRAYCPHGGVSIGFVFEDLQQLAKKNGLLLVKCIYSIETKHALLKELLDNATGDFLANKPLDECAESFILHYRLIAPSFKHPSFAEEREWRLIPDPTTYAERAFSTNDLRPFDVRVAGSMLVPYYKLPLAELGIKKNKQYLGFDNVLVSPHYHAQKLIGTVSFLFNCQNVYRCHVSHSDSSYRTNR